MKSNDLSTITNLSKNFKTLKQVNVSPSDTFYAWQNKHKKKRDTKTTCYSARGHTIFLILKFHPSAASVQIRSNY